MQLNQVSARTELDLQRDSGRAIVCPAHEELDGGALTTRNRDRPRLTGIDVARLVAIVGMVMVHFGPNPVPETTAGTVYDVSHGRASILFVFLAGIGVTFLARSVGSRRVSVGVAQILSRALLLLPLGLWLQSLDHGVLVILQYYAIYFLFGALVVWFPDRAVLGVAIAALLIGPITYDFASQNLPEWFAGDPPVLGDPASEIAPDLVLSGYYPLVTWAAPFTFGIWVGRQNLASARVRWWLIGVGLAIAVATAIVGRYADANGFEVWRISLSTEPHSQAHMWLLGSTGAAFLVLGAALVLTELAGNRLWPLVAAGQLALTIYVGHLILLHYYSDLLRHEEVGNAALSVALFMALAIALSTVWRSVFSHGPLETIFRIPSWILNRAGR